MKKEYKIVANKVKNKIDNCFECDLFEFCSRNIDEAHEDTGQDLEELTNLMWVCIDNKDYHIELK